MRMARPASVSLVGEVTSMPSDCKPSLSRHCKLGILERIGRGLYRKVGPATTLPDLRPTG